MSGTFTFLGTGASTGIPVIGCKCAVCSSSSPKNKRLRPSGLVRLKKLALLIDASPDCRQQALRYQIDRLDGLLMTHTHFDHVAGIDDLRSYYLWQKQALPCLLSKESIEELKIRYYYLFQPIGLSPTLSTQLNFHVLPQESGQIDFLGVKIGYFSYFQGTMKVTGYRIGNLAYVSDIRDFSDAIFEWLSGVETLIVSALREEPTQTMFTVEEAVAFSKRSGVKKAYLTHMNHELDHDKINQKLPSDVRLAYDGLEIEFGN